MQFFALRGLKRDTEVYKMHCFMAQDPPSKRVPKIFSIIDNFSGLFKYKNHRQKIYEIFSVKRQFHEILFEKFFSCLEKSLAGSGTTRSPFSTLTLSGNQDFSCWESSSPSTSSSCALGSPSGSSRQTSPPGSHWVSKTYQIKSNQIYLLSHKDTDNS